VFRNAAPGSARRLQALILCLSDAFLFGIIMCPVNLFLLVAFIRITLELMLFAWREFPHPPTLSSTRHLCTACH
jgi:hypothetical protein